MAEVLKTALSSQSVIDQTEHVSAHNYHPLPVVISRVHVWVEVGGPNER